MTQITNVLTVLQIAIFFKNKDSFARYSNHDSILNTDLVTIWENQMRLCYCHKSATIRGRHLWDVREKGTAAQFNIYVHA